MLVSKDAGDQDQDAAKTTQPVCPNCGAARECVLEQIPSPASYLLSLISLYYFGIWSMFIIPLIFQSTKIIVKRCYFCNVEIETRKLFQIPNINDQVLQFKFGGCMIVISRKYAIILLLIIIGLVSYIQYNKEPPVQEVKRMASKSWVEFLSLCGKFQFVDNGLKARHQFEEYFKNKYVRWSGDYIQTKKNMDMHYPYDYWIYVKMVPTESAQDYPDIILGVTKSHIQSDILQKLKIGQPIEFEAKFLQLGSEYQQHLLELEWLHMENKPIEDINNLEKFTINLERTRRGYPSIMRDSIKKVIHNYKDYKKDYKGKIKRIDFGQNQNAQVIDVPKVDFNEAQNTQYDHLNNLKTEEQNQIQQNLDQDKQKSNDNQENQKNNEQVENKENQEQNQKEQKLEQQHDLDIQNQQQEQNENVDQNNKTNDTEQQENPSKAQEEDQQIEKQQEIQNENLDIVVDINPDNSQENQNEDAQEPKEDQ